MDTYAYHHLHNNQIRLLELSAGNNQEALSVQLRSVSLDDEFNYEALSYTWGTSTKSSHLMCGTSAIAITPNLEKALLRLRPKTHVRTLWVDQICINQDNLEERNAQVALMGAIYSRADTVLVWIGEEDDLVQQAFQFLPILLSYLPSDPEAIQSTKLRLPVAALPIARSPAWEALSTVFSRPWFRRVWVIQEVALAKKAVVYCGSFTADWQSLAKASACQLGLQDASDAHDAVEAITSLRRMNDEHFVNALFMSYRFHCTNPRDKIYAFLGLSGGLRNSTPSPNYGLSIEEIYLSVTKSLILAHNSLDILCCVTFPKKSDLLPSWVPDWQSEAMVQGMLRAPVKSQTKTQTGSVARFSADNQTLLVNGKMRGFITELSMTMPRYFHESYDMMPDWEQFARNASSSDDRAFPTNYRRTLLAYGGEGEGGGDADKRNDHLYQIWDKVDKRNRGKAAVQSDNPGAEGDIAAGFQAAMEETCAGRRLCIASGLGLGLVPDAACIRDAVCCFDGGPVPFVIRKADELCGEEVYRLIGECYFEGCFSDDMQSTGISRHFSQFKLV